MRKRFSSLFAGLARLPGGITAGLIGALLCCQTAATAQTPTGPPAAALRLDQLAAQLETEPAGLRAELARIVLNEMAAAYAAEAARARGDMRRSNAAADLRRWAAAVDGLAGELAALAGTVTEVTPVQATVNRDGSVTLLVDGRPVEVNGPSLADQAALERRIIEQFCSLYSCDSGGTRNAPAQSVTVPAGRTPHWSFGADAGPLCSTDDGLQFRFHNTDDLRRKREACSLVVAELERLIAAIQEYQAAGGIPDWEALSIHSLPGGDLQRVGLGVAGDFVEAYLPALAAAPDLLDLLRPWLITRVNALEPQPLVIDAETLLPPTGFLGQ